MLLGALELAELDKSLVTRQGGRTWQEGSLDATQWLDKEAVPTCCSNSKLLMGVQMTAGGLVVQLLCAADPVCHQSAHTMLPAAVSASCRQ
jgi:hypothetical protein